MDANRRESGSRMGAVVGLFKPFGGQVGIDLRGDEVCMAEQFLDAPQVGAGVQHVGGIAVAQLVRTEVRIQARDGEVLLQSQLQLPR